MGADVAQVGWRQLSEFHSKDAQAFDFVFTVCNQAANEECPTGPGQPITAHWGLPDPVKVDGSDAEKSLAFQQAYGTLRNRMLGFTSLPLTSLDRISVSYTQLTPAKTSSVQTPGVSLSLKKKTQ